MGSLDNFLTIIKKYEDENLFAISSKHFPEVIEWQNGQKYDITVIYREALQMERIEKETGEIVVYFRLHAAPIISGQNSRHPRILQRIEIGQDQ